MHRISFRLVCIIVLVYHLDGAQFIWFSYFFGSLTTYVNNDNKLSKMTAHSALPLFMTGYTCSYSTVL